jgi:hypothetical protein
MQLRYVPAIGVGLAITASVGLAQTLPANEAAVPVQFLAAIREAPGEFVRCTARNALVAGVLAYAHARLEITSSQEPAWARFAEALQQALKPIDSLCHDSAASAPMPTSLSGLMERRERSGEVMVQVMKPVRLAVGDLEASLTPEQRQRLVELVVSLPK